MPIQTHAKKSPEKSLEVFEAIGLLGLESSRAGELLIDDLAKERVNAVAWNQIKSNSDKFNEFLDTNKWFWEELYIISKDSLKGEYPALVVAKTSKQIIPCEIISIVKSAITKKIFSAIVLVDIVEWKNSTWKVTWNFQHDSESVVTELELIKGNDLPKKDKDLFLKEQKYIYPQNIKKGEIPLVEWKSLPNNDVFYEQALEKSKTLSIANDIYIDQLLNSMTKRVEIDTSQTTGGPKEAEEQNTKNLIFKAVSYVKSSTMDEFDKVQAMYQPAFALIEAHRNNIDWLEEKIRDVGKSLKDDDSDSAQKSEIELININRSATDALELNLSMWTRNLEQLIKIYDSSLKEVEVELKLRSIGEMMKKKTENIGIEDLEVNTNNVGN